MHDHRSEATKRRQGKIRQVHQGELTGHSAHRRWRMVHSIRPLATSAKLPSSTRRSTARVLTSFDRSAANK
jgi:hypothetical protein